MHSLSFPGPGAIIAAAYTAGGEKSAGRLNLNLNLNVGPKLKQQAQAQA